MQGGVLVPWAIAERLKTHFDFVNLPESIDSIPPSVNVMMVVHPKALSERAIYELEQFLFRGGRVLLFVDPKSESDPSVGPLQVSDSTNSLRKLFDQWGVKIPQGRVVGDRTLALRINAGSATQPIPANYLAWLGVTGDSFSREDPVTSQLTTLNLPTAGYIQLAENSSLAMKPLIVSTTNSSPLDVDSLKGLRPDILGLLDRFNPDEQSYVMAARAKRCGVDSLC